MTPIPIRVFLSSPGDVADERNLARKVITDLNNRDGLRGHFDLKIEAWDDPKLGIPMPAHQNPQISVNEYLVKPSECDIVIVILWSRIGSPCEVEGVKHPSGTAYECREAIAHAEQHGAPIVLIYRRIEPPRFDAADPEWEHKVQQYRDLREFIASEFGEDGSKCPYKRFSRPSEFEETLEKDLTRLLFARVDQNLSQSSAPIESPIGKRRWTDSPFPGLRPLRPPDEPIFFGRGRETDELLRRVKDNRFVAVVGMSGSGKSSLVGAGLIPRLRPLDWLLPDFDPIANEWRGLRFTPGELGDDPFLAFANKLAPMVNRSKPDVRSILADDTESLDQLCSEALRLAKKPDESQVLVFLDQFEELFTLIKDKQRQSEFVRRMIAAIDGKHVRVIVTIRKDFVPRCDEVPGLTDLLNQSSLFVGAPSPLDLVKMVQGPADCIGLKFEDDLPQRIATETGDNPGGLALMAYALDELYRLVKLRDRTTITYEDYQTIGGVRRAIVERAERTYSDLPVVSSDKRTLLARVFRKLIAIDNRGEPTRRRVPKDEFEGDERTLAEAFDSARLLTAGSESDGVAIWEVSHEALLREWDTLSRWIREHSVDLKRIEQAEEDAREWEQARKLDPSRADKEFLWTGNRLAELRDALLRLDIDPHEPLRSFCRPQVERLREAYAHKTGTLDVVAIILQLAGSVVPEEQQMLQEILADYKGDPVNEGLNIQVFAEKFLATSEEAFNPDDPKFIQRIEYEKEFTPKYEDSTPKDEAEVLPRKSTKEIPNPSPIAVSPERPEDNVSNEDRILSVDLRQESDGRKRRLAVESLGRHGQSESVPSLLMELDPAVEDIWYVRSAAAMALGQIGTPEAVEGLCAALDSSHETNPYVRRDIAKALGLVKNSEGVSRLLATLDPSNETDYRVRLAATESLGKVATHEAVPTLITSLSRRYETSWHVRKEIARTLRKIGSEEALEAALEWEKRGIRNQ